jgi:hypothetical protein
MWERVEKIVDGAPSVAALRHHGVELVAARVRREGGRAVPRELREDERRAALRALAAPVLLKRVRAAYTGPLVLMKGPEVAAHYPRSGVRTFCDLDLLVDDPYAAHRALKAAGFIEVGPPARYHGVHHLRPLAVPDLPLFVELHREPNRPRWLPSLPLADLLELTEPSATGVTGLQAPVRAVHALLIAAHGWAHEPLRRLLDLIDIGVLLRDGDRALAHELAHRWGLQRVWATTLGAMDGVLGGRRQGLAARVWARHLVAVRERTVFETHLTRWAGPVHGLPGTRLRALGGGTLIFSEAARPREDERWADVIRRVSLAMADASRPQSQHDLIKEARTGR